MNQQSLINAVKTASRENWRDAISWLAYTVLGTFLPLLASFFLLGLRHQEFHLNDFLRHGEFALYTAAFLAPALQLIVRSMRTSGYVLGTGSVLISVFGLVLSAIVYSGVVTSSGLPSGVSQILDERFLFWISILMLPASLAFSLVVNLMENQRMSPNFDELEAHSRQNLAEQFQKKLEAEDGRQ